MLLSACALCGGAVARAAGAVCLAVGTYLSRSALGEIETTTYSYNLGKRHFVTARPSGALPARAQRPEGGPSMPLDCAKGLTYQSWRENSRHTNTR